MTVTGGGPPPPPGWLSRPLGGRVDPSTLRGALWTARSLRSIRRALRQQGLQASVRTPPALPWGATRGVVSVLARQPNTCLERALVLQAWLGSQGYEHEVVVGVKGGSTDFAAHAWMDYEDGTTRSMDFEELTRLTPRRPGRRA